MAQEFGGQVGIWIIYNNDSDFSSSMSVLDRQCVLFIYWKEAADKNPSVAASAHVDSVLCILAFCCCCHYESGTLVPPPVTMIKYPDKHSLREEGLNLVYSSRIQSTVEESYCPIELEPGTPKINDFQEQFPSEPVR